MWFARIQFRRIKMKINERLRNTGNGSRNFIMIEKEKMRKE